MKKVLAGLGDWWSGGWSGVEAAGGDGVAPGLAPTGRSMSLARRNHWSIVGWARGICGPEVVELGAVGRPGGRTPSGLELGEFGGCLQF